MAVVDFIIQFLGFFLQTIPIALLMSVVFESESLKLTRKKTAAILLVPDALCSLGFALWEINIPCASFEELQPTANVIMAVFIVIMYGIFLSVIKAPVLNKLIVLMILTHYAAILFTVNGIILALLDVYGNYGKHIYSGYDLLTNFILTAVTFPLIYFFVIKIVRPAMKLLDNKIMRRGLIYSCLAFFLFCGAVMLFDFTADRASYKEPNILVFFFTFIFTDCILYYMFFFEAKLVTENNRLMSRIQSFDEQYRRISRDVDESRRLRHDMRHHLNAISAINKKQENKELTEYLESYSAVYAELEAVTLCGYHALDNILLYYISLAKEKGIKITTRLHSLSGDMDFDATDITVLVGNLMENAIEACERLSDGEKFIRVNIRQSGAFLLIKEENSCREDAEPQSDYTGSESFVSTKHAKHPGQGLKSIALVAEKYGGSAEFKRENGVFTARAVLNIP